jgi:transposase
MRQLRYKAAWYGRTVVAVERFFASSKTCHACGWVVAELALDVREWVCGGCEVELDRDVNAAQNILAEGLRLITLESKALAVYAVTTTSNTPNENVSTQSTVRQTERYACGAVVRPQKGSFLQKRTKLEGQTAVKQEVSWGFHWVAPV